MAQPTTACIIGAGPGGIAIGYELKKKLKCNDFVIVDQHEGAGGTWFSNSYPGCGCDVPSIFYSFSFAMNPKWTKPLAEQPEILQYLNDVIDRFDLRSHLVLSTKVIGATWKSATELWEVEFQNVKDKHIYKRSFRVVVTACGVFSNPRYPDIKGREQFKGATWHTGRWNWDYDLSGKRVALIGNGCSGCQVIPAIAPKVKSLTHLARGRQWLFDRPNEPYSKFAIWMYSHIPGWMLWERFWTYYSIDNLFWEYVKNPNQESLVAVSEQDARAYMTRKTPKKYLEDVIPDFPVGCKRRVMDPGYLDALHRPNVDLCSKNIASIDEAGIKLENGSHIDADVIIYATGFHTQEYLSPMEFTGQGGKTLNEHWKDTKGCQAYMGTTVSGFPNFGMLFGPNASPVHNSVIYVLEVQATYIAQTFFEPLLTGRARTITVKASAEDYDCNLIQQGLADGVWHKGCSNWVTNKDGRNCTTFPGYVRSFWWKLYWPRFQDYWLTGGEKSWRMRYLALKASQYRRLIYVSMLGMAGGVLAASTDWPKLASALK